MEEGGWRLRGYSPFFMLLAHCVRCNEAATRAVSVRIGYLISYLGPQCHQSTADPTKLAPALTQLFF